MKMKLIKISLLFVMCLTFIDVAFAQDASPKKWHYLGEVYMMFPSMSGEVGVGRLPEVEVDASSSDILGNLKMGAMFYLEASNNDWSISSDLLYMKLGQGVTNDGLVTSGDITMKEMAWEIAGFKRLAPWLDMGVAGRFVYLYSGLNLQTINDPKSGSASKNWFDPVIVIRSNNVIKEKWLAQLRLDAGGFGIGSDFTWQLQANVGYRFTKLFQTSIGYRYIGIDYDQGENEDRFLYDIDTYGWVIRCGFNF